MDFSGSTKPQERQLNDAVRTERGGGAQRSLLVPSLHGSQPAPEEAQLTDGRMQQNKAYTDTHVHTHTHTHVHRTHAAGNSVF